MPTYYGDRESGCGGLVAKAVGVVALAGILVGLGFGGCSVTNRIHYSDGIRAGQVTKVSKKGIFWKTYEAQMNTGGALQGEGNNVIPEVWEFSLDASRRNGENTEQLVESLEKAARTGERVEVKYKEYLTSAPWNGNEGYYAQKVVFLQTPENATK